MYVLYNYIVVDIVLANKRNLVMQWDLTCACKWCSHRFFSKFPWGLDREFVADQFLTCNLRAMRTGDVQYACILDSKGLIMDDAFVFLEDGCVVKLYKYICVVNFCGEWSSWSYKGIGMHFYMEFHMVSKLLRYKGEPRCREATVEPTQLVAGWCCECIDLGMPVKATGGLLGSICFLVANVVSFLMFFCLLGKIFSRLLHPTFLL